MLRNVIFDMGNVLIEFDPMRFVRCVAPDSPEDAELLLKEIFHSEEWKMQDAGELDEAGVEERVCRRLPARLRASAHRLIFEWDRFARPVEGMAELAADCKAAGLGVYLLSNASVRQPEYWPRVPGSECFDGTVISALEKCVKPEMGIFQKTMETFGLKAEECLFVDDVQSNVDGAIRAGLMGFRFEGSAGALRERLRYLGAPV